MRFRVLTVASMKMAVFWNVVPCGLVEEYRRFRVMCIHHHDHNRPDNRGRKQLCKVGKLLPDYNMQQLRRQPSSTSNKITINKRLEQSKQGNRDVSNDTQRPLNFIQKLLPM
jgi:hypothetical protein